ncbi:hypothetical protein MPSEU_000270900 [Mayamaea pseudoterrestris]|nr:hypothetical protein MPSEU_000270900 [Mayamaea pseudoterrestris]
MVILNAAIQHFVFVYGSLLCQQSRAVTASSLSETPVLPVLCTGLQRVWAKRSKRGMTSLGVRVVEDSDTTSSKLPSCVGAVVPIWGSDALSKLDEREQGYERVPLTLEQIRMVPYLDKAQYYTFNDENSKSASNKMKSNVNEISSADEDWLDQWLAQTTRSQQTSMYEATLKPRVWTYRPLREQWPDDNFPIAQTYVDTILRGCLSYAPEMAHDFITSTEGWDGGESSDMDGVSTDTTTATAAHWYNDRHDPIYPRGDPEWSRRHATSLDDLLQQHLPEQMNRRVVRPKE